MKLLELLWLGRTFECSCDCGDRRVFRLFGALRAERWLNKHAETHDAELSRLAERTEPSHAEG